MALGFGILGLAPAVFWSMTPRELESAIRGRAGGADVSPAPTRAGLESLMSKFPDGE